LHPPPLHAFPTRRSSDLPLLNNPGKHCCRPWQVPTAPSAHNTGYSAGTSLSVPLPVSYSSPHLPSGLYSGEYVAPVCLYTNVKVYNWYTVKDFHEISESAQCIAHGLRPMS